MRSRTSSASYGIPDEWIPYSPDLPSSSFEDVGGCDKIKAELRDILSLYRRHRKKKLPMEVRLPRGILFVGPPGVGKTHLARAVAGEAGLPLFSIAASELIEMFVGVGAHRVRMLFEAARRRIPSVVFIDEVDMIGRIRGGSTVPDESEREQTLNALLSELDGFRPLDGVLVIAASNRFELLDSALRRPGRFDLVFQLKYPDLSERRKIFGVLLQKLSLGFEIETVGIRLAEQTRGASQADLASIARRAVQVAVQSGSKTLDERHLQQALTEWSSSSSPRQLFDAFLLQGHGLLSDAALRPRTRVFLRNGEVVEGYAQWQDSEYLKMRTPEQPEGIILSKAAIHRLECVENWG